MPGVYSWVTMNRLMRWTLLLAVGNCGLCLPARGSDGLPPGNPYASICERNVFGLRPQVAPPPVSPPAPAVKVILTGITTMPRGKRALLRIEFPPQRGKPAQAESCTLGEGQRDGPVEVLAINVKTERVTLDDSGTIMTITFEKPSPTPAPAPRRPFPYWPRGLVRAASR
jgi:hypothetical protein